MIYFLINQNETYIKRKNMLLSPQEYAKKKQ